MVDHMVAEQQSAATLRPLGPLPAPMERRQGRYPLAAAAEC